MPALAKPPAFLPRFLPHLHTGATAKAGSLSPTLRQPEGAPGIDRLAHDARNILAGLMLYSELLAAPGVLNQPHGHYAQELEGLAGAAARILEKIVAAAPTPAPGKISDAPALPTATALPLAPIPVNDAAADLRRLQPLLAAIAGPAVRLSVATMPCAGRTALAVEDLTRVLVNLVRNAADAMPAGGHIGIAAQYGRATPEAASYPSPRSVVLSISDDGPGIPEALRPHLFDLGFTTHRKSAAGASPRRRGLGLSIVRNLVEAAGGAVNVTASHTGGARFEITLPLAEPVSSERSIPSGRSTSARSITSGTCAAAPNSGFPADSGEKGCIQCQ